MKKTVTVIRQSDAGTRRRGSEEPRFPSGNCGYVEGTMCERIGMVWPLTREVVSLSKKYDAEQRLQRHITRFIKQKG